MERPEIIAGATTDNLLSGSSMRMHSRYVRRHRLCDNLTEGLLYILIVLGPWLFGTTQNWAVWVMNIGSYLLGLLLAIKWLIRRKVQFRPACWNMDAAMFLTETPIPSVSMTDGKRIAWERVIGWWKRQRLCCYATQGLAATTVLVLLYCLVSAFNARANFNEASRILEYNSSFINWLPHSYDASSTWFSFWMYLGTACFFWALRDWLLVKSRSELPENTLTESTSQAYNRQQNRNSNRAWYHIPTRLRKLLWVLSINAFLVCIEGILQRFSGTDELLWLVRPRFCYYNASQFGPYAYRTNAAQYFNLVWPVCLGFWWLLNGHSSESRRRRTRIGGSPQMILIVFVVFMIVGSIASTSRGGFIIATLQVFGALIVFGIMNRHRLWTTVLSLLGVMVIVVSLGAWLGWNQLLPRLQQAVASGKTGREEIFINSNNMAKDFVWLGSGPGTYGNLYYFYRSDVRQTWSWYAHDDWMETKITFGILGFTLILVGLSLVFVSGMASNQMKQAWPFKVFVLIGMVGCLIHAKFDFPFQVHSILFLFVLLCSLFCCPARLESRLVEGSTG